MDGSGCSVNRPLFKVQLGYLDLLGLFFLVFGNRISKDLQFLRRDFYHAERVPYALMCCQKACQKRLCNESINLSKNFQGSYNVRSFAVYNICVIGIFIFFNEL